MGKVYKQPAWPWLVTEIKRTITELPGGYAEAAEWLGATENSFFNRLRSDGDQTFHFGWAMLLQRAGGSNYIADAVAFDSNGVFVKLPVIEQMGNEELLFKFNELLSALGRFARFHNESTSDSVLDSEETRRMKAKDYCVQALVAEIMVVTECCLERVTPASVQLRASWRTTLGVWRNNPHEQFNRKLPFTATKRISRNRFSLVSI